MKKIALVLAFILFLIIVRSVNAQDMATIVFTPRGQATVGQNTKIDVYINSNTTINAAQISVTYPQSEFQLVSIDSSKSSFSIKAEEKGGSGIIKVARGNIKALKGKSLFTSFTVKSLSQQASTSHFGYSVTDSVVMSYTNQNILAGSMVQTVIPKTPLVIPTTPSTTTTNSSTGITSIVSNAVKIFLNGLFK